jgi:hypothetical protein
LAFAMRARRRLMDGSLRRRSVTLTRRALVARGTDSRSCRRAERERIPNAKGSGAAGPRQPRLVIARRPWRTPHDTVKAPEANRARCEPCAQLGSQPTRVLASQEAAAPTPEQPAREASKGRSMPEEPRSTATGSWGRMPGRRRVLDNRDALAGAGDAAGAFARMRVRPSVISQSCPA